MTGIFDNSKFENTYFPHEKANVQSDIFFQTSETLLTFKSSLSLSPWHSSFQEKKRKEI